MNRTPYATDGEYTLYPLADIDRENYAELQRQITGRDTYCKNHDLADMMWETTINNGDLMYSIFDKNNVYCGSLEHQNPTSAIPGIGIELMEHKRNQGIAAKVVKLLVQKVCQERDVEYFLIKISSRNLHSQHVFEKMGATHIGEEDTLAKTLINQFTKEGLSVPKDCQDVFYYVLSQEYDEVVYRYKLLPDVFE